jgi:preprotein translocase subunit SecA
MNRTINQIKIESKNLHEKTDDELKILIEKITRRAEKEKLENIIPIWFALVQEISNRTIGLKHFDTQLLAGLYLHEGKVVEMKTGEGKTLASTLPVSLNALSKKGVHVVTVNDYLAERDKNLMGKLYSGLGLSSGLVKSVTLNSKKKENYDADITYITNSELVFDFLRDNSAFSVYDLVQRPLNFCVIDEIDSILIDEARTPLIISEMKGQANTNKLSITDAIVKLLSKNDDFEIDQKRNDINLTEKGYKEISKKLGKESLYDPNDPWILEILNALKANYLYKKDKEYIVLNDKIVIVDEFTGRIMEDRRWSMGLHEAIETKEQLKVAGETKGKKSITYQNFFALYPKLSGMTGTAKTNEKEFKDIYNLKVVAVPTAKPMVRKDLSDLVYQNELSKWKAVLEQSKKCFKVGQPVLIGTVTVEKSEFLSDLFNYAKIPHQVLNAKPENLKRENEIIAQAGEPYAITIATNMAGRGTDIILGGNPIFKVKQTLEKIIFEKKEIEESIELKNLILNLFEEYKNFKSKLKLDVENLPYSLETSQKSLNLIYNYLYKKIFEKWEKNNLFVKQLGGLFVLGTERHETRRIDNQLRGRAGRQGDPGMSQFYISLDDNLIKVFGGDSIKRWVNYLLDDKDAPLESNILTNSLETAQKKVEAYNYEIRKNVFQYDEVLNTQRKKVFNIRNEILKNNISSNFFLRLSETLTCNYLGKKDKSLLIPFSYIYERKFSPYSTYLLERKNASKEILFKEVWMTLDLKYAQSNYYEMSLLKNLCSEKILEILDFYWTEHLDRMNYIRDTINWRSYGQQNPLVEYNLEAFDSFVLMFEQIRFYSLSFLTT